MRKLASLVVASGVVLAIGACGGDPVQGPTDPAESQPLDFGAVAGSWNGDWTASNGTSGQLEVDLNASAAPGQVVGTAEWLDASGDAVVCTANWIAVSAEAPQYTVEDDVVSGEEGCLDGIVRLSHDSGAGTLDFEFEVVGAGTTGSGTLMRQN